MQVIKSRDGLELLPHWFDRHEADGVTTDASTPDFSIDAVVARIEEIAKD